MVNDKAVCCVNDQKLLFLNMEHWVRVLHLGGPTTMDMPTDTLSWCVRILCRSWIFVTDCITFQLPLSSAVTPLATSCLPCVLFPWLAAIRGLKWKHLREVLIVHMLKYSYAALMKRDVGSQLRTQEFFRGGFNKFSWGQRTERTGIWRR